MARQLFGTDGIRGVAGEFPLDPRTVQAAGIALGRLASRLGRNPEVILGIDTRESGPWLAEELAGGLVQAGARPRFAGLITTPGIAYLTRTDSFVAGVMISASHNPYQDNGIKIFGHSGYKLSDAQETELESEILGLLEAGFTAARVTLAEDPGLDERYLAYLSSTFPHSLEGFRLVVDCANGAATRLAPALFERLGASVDAIGCAPDGRNINLDCGALHVEGLREAVLAQGADAGVALDGDADRAIFVSRSGKIVDGDGVMLVAARFLARARRIVRPRRPADSGCHRDVEPRPGEGALEAWDPHAADGGRRQICAGGDATDRRRVGWRAVGPRDLPQLLHRGRRPADHAARARSHASFRRGSG